MIVTIGNQKGGVGKTSLAISLALEFGYSIGTNESNALIELFLEEERTLAVSFEEEFPDLSSVEDDVILDLSGAMAKTGLSIVSAIQQSDVLVIPVTNQLFSINHGVNYYLVASEYIEPENIIIVANMLNKDATRKTGRKTPFTGWENVSDFKEIKDTFVEQVGSDVKVLPLRETKALVNVIECEMSVSDYIDTFPITRSRLKEPLAQLTDIHKNIQQFR